MGISEAMATIEEFADEDASVIFGTTTNENIGEDEVYITIIATGFEKDLKTEEVADKKDFSKEKVNSTVKPANVNNAAQIKTSRIIYKADLKVDLYDKYK